MAVQPPLPPETLGIRYRALYTSAVSDTLDALGLRNQVLPPAIAPVTPDMVIAGPAFTCQGYPVADAAADDSPTRIRMLESLPAGSVSVWATAGQAESAVWGEIMSHAARERGCTGAVVDGGCRDSRFVLEMRFPVFCRFRSAASSIGRWGVREWQVPIRIGATLIHPNDFVFGDLDGVVVVPREYVVEVLSRTEETVKRESGMRAEFVKGVSVSEAYQKYGKF